MKINNLKTPDQPQSTQKPINEFYNQLLIPSNSPLRSSAKSLQMPRVLATTPLPSAGSLQGPRVLLAGIC